MERGEGDTVDPVLGCMIKGVLRVPRLDLLEILR